MYGMTLPNDPTVFWALVSAVVASLGLIWAVVSSARSASSATLLRRAQFYMEFTDRYNTQDMHSAMQTLISYYDSRPDDFAQHYADEFGKRSEEGIQLDKHRRTLNRYYVNIADMTDNNLLDRKMAMMLTNFQGLNIYYLIVAPMNRAKYANNEKNEQVFRTLKGIRKVFNDGSFALKPHETGTNRS